MPILWSFAASALAAVMTAHWLILFAERRRGDSTRPPLASAALLQIGATIFLLSGIILWASRYAVNHQATPLSGEMYRVRVIVLNPEGDPVKGAVLRTSVSADIMTGEGVAVVSFQKDLIPADGRLTIFADVVPDSLHGRADLWLASDFSPAVTIVLGRALNATITGLVEDEKGQGVEGVRVSVLGGEADWTNTTGIFSLKTDAAIGQAVRIRAEKPGYAAVDMLARASTGPLTLTMVSLRAMNERTGTVPSRTAADAFIIQYKAELLDLRLSFESAVASGDQLDNLRRQAVQLADRMASIDDRQLSAARLIIKHEYLGWALLLVADSYGERPGSSEVQVWYAQEAIRAFDFALLKMAEISRDFKASHADAIPVYNWIAGESADQDRTHWLKAAALAVAARASGSSRTRADALEELNLISPSYRISNPPQNHPALAWALGARATAP